LTFIYSSTRFGRPHAHHQELNNYSSNLWFYLRSVVIASAVGRGRAGYNRLLLQLLSSWWWAWKRPKHI